MSPTSINETHESEFASAIAVERQSDTSFTADIDGDWSVAGAVNGGYLLSVAGLALRNNSAKAPDPLVLSTYYLGPSQGGRAEITTRLIREGRSSATFAVDLSQNTDPKITALATMGNLAALPDDVATTAIPPELPDPDQCINVAEAPGDFIESAPLMKRYDMRLDPETAGFATGRPSGRGLLQGWIRLADGTAPDALSLLAFLDAFPPVMFDLGRFNWAPTMELTAHLRAEPAPGWIRAKLYTRNIAGGMFEEDCELWDSAGRLVAQSRQLARQPRD
ncbi:MAG: thioesterase family protein [Brevibacterium aurantiacum]|uniref:Acyl-CoA thioesterase n=2 Tax=Brevibacterium aurantiacum TaxID=273384 RepID=A0A2A3Z1H3_BREAU|nr:thioesterase family protein [Brevibacterium aurantiacum]MDN5594148.1 thioesterase family protein [Brevibacterium sp.]MDN6373970.1 thioesterase family protein [Brevibacterium aurantiacum]PCC44281.1 TesB-like acyl-CoA thioesterase 3 [Brevibacterium aurantiacum]PCC45368.1 TesB-like acyl-CoA thioesterase 3 [Brevibacterium aurantiacum]RCS92584.1 thioesterase family protein [Brevibacterium aurantiacum]